jgi:hypothetical protein
MPRFFLPDLIFRKHHLIGRTLYGPRFSARHLAGLLNEAIGPRAHIIAVQLRLEHADELPRTMEIFKAVNNGIVNLPGGTLNGT